MNQKRRTSLSDRMYRCLLRLFPFDFQREHGGDMEYVFRQERKQAGRKGHWFPVALWWRTLIGFFRTAPLEHLDVFRRDIRFGIRSLAKKPGFTLVAISALAIGIGASTAVFGLANALLLKPLPVADPHRVIRVFANNFSNMPYADYGEYRDRNRTISDLSAFQALNVNIRIAESPESALAFAVTGNHFSGIGVIPALGRMIGPGDDQPGAAGTAMLSDAFWRRRFGADPGIVGRTLSINGSFFTIVGVAPPSFTGTLAPVQPELWISWNGLEHGRPLTVLLLGRLRPGVSISEAQADLSLIASQLTQERGRPIRVTAYSARTMHPELYIPVAGFAAFLMAIAGLVLTIACLNIATMLLARAAERRREMGIRIALGAGRTQLMRQLLTEGLLLSMAGGGAAMIIVLLAGQTVPLSFPGLPLESVALDLSIDWRVGLFAAAISLATTLLFAVVPAQSAKADVLSALKDTILTGSTRSRLRAAFIVAQVATSTLLLVLGALLVRTLTNPQTADPGLDTAGVLTAGINLGNAAYEPERGMEFQERILQSLEAAPGVVSANIVKIVPLTLSNDESIFRWVPSATLLVKTHGDAMNVLPAIRTTVQSLDPGLPLSGVAGLNEAVGISLLPLQVAAALAAVLGLVALILGALGIYGVVSYLVRQRTREIGIRMALGAAPSGVVGLMTRQALSWTAIGLGLGLLAALAAGQLLAILIYGFAATDPVAFAGIPLLLSVTAYAACWIPARRASRIDPLSALREE